jgi:hypothetical protein
MRHPVFGSGIEDQVRRVTEQHPRLPVRIPKGDWTIGKLCLSGAHCHASLEAIVDRRATGMNRRSAHLLVGKLLMSSSGLTMCDTLAGIGAGGPT